MLIECLRIRPGGTYVPLGDKEYRFFERHTGGPHVAEVTDPDHIRILLAIAAYAPAQEPVITPAMLADAVGAPATQNDADPIAIAAPTLPVEPVAKPLDAMTDEDLDAEYLALFGRKPHGRAKRETIIADITAKRAEG